ncbi:MFS transporter [Halostagnicola bangensis]
MGEKESGRGHADDGTTLVSPIGPETVPSAFIGVAILSLIWFVLSVYRITFSVSLPDFLEVTGITYTGVSVLFGAFFSGYALSQFPAGLLADRFDPETIIASSILATTVALGSLSVASSYAHVFLAVLVIGSGIGSYRAVSQIAVAHTVPDRMEGAALGLLTAANPLGYVVGPVAIAILLTKYDVYTVPLLLALVPVPLVLLAYLVNPVSIRSASKVGRGPTARQALSTFREHLCATTTLLVIAFGTAFTTTSNSLLAILPLYLVETTSLSLTVGGLYAGGIFGVGAIAALIGGVFRDRVGAIPILVAGFVTAAVALAVLSFVSSLPHVLATLAVFSLGLNSILPARDRVINSHASDCSDRHTGAMIGGLRSLCYLGGSLGAVLVGLGFARFGVTVGFNSLIAVLVIGAICVTALWNVENSRY